MSKGELLIIGGNENKEENTEILTKFVELSKSKRDGGRIGILPTASEIPEEVSAQYTDIFQRLGAEQVEVIRVESREQAENLETANRILGLSGLFITGGDQSRLRDIIGDTKLFHNLYRSWLDGMVLAGTSAGASIMGKQMIVAADIKAEDDKSHVKISDGFGLLENLIIDQHFSQRARFDRLLNAIAESSHVIGIGIDENTAILVKDDIFRVYGEHQVIVIDGKDRDFIDIRISENGSEELTVSGFQLHTLTKGYSFDLSSRKLLNRREE